MKELDKQLSSLLMKFESAETSREEYETTCEMEKLIADHKKSMIYDDKNVSYFDKAVKIFMSDVADFLSTYKNENRTPCYDCYDILFRERAKKIRVEIHNSSLALHGFGVELEHIPQHTVLQIIGFDKNVSKYVRAMTEGEFEEFLKIKSENSLYFVPYIKKAMKIMNEMIEIK